MPMPAIRPTTTTRVRHFLRENNIHLAPWSSLEQTYGRFYALLMHRKGDTRFCRAGCKSLAHATTQAVTENHYCLRLQNKKA
ncbi:MAG: hypothetical protein JXX14_05270 [Deltaproteobacteria bacterium]|nr:hypothetical protein [Deltaproteobacteria bacterium]